MHPLQPQRFTNLGELLHEARDDAAIQVPTAALGALYRELRAIHLLAHLRTAEMMTDEQIEAYDELRGYEPSGGP